MLAFALTLAGCTSSNGSDAAEPEPSETGAVQPIKLTTDADVEFVEFDEEPRPEPRELFNETFTYSPTRNLGDLEFEVEQEWFFVRILLQVELDGSTSGCGFVVGDATDSSDWAPQRYLDEGRLPTTGALVTTPSGFQSWIPYHSGAFCPTQDADDNEDKLQEYHVFTGEIGSWKIEQSGRGMGVQVVLGGLGTDELPEIQGGDTSTL